MRSEKTIELTDGISRCESFLMIFRPTTAMQADRSGPGEAVSIGKRRLRISSEPCVGTTTTRPILGGSLLLIDRLPQALGSLLCEGK